MILALLLVFSTVLSAVGTVTVTESIHRTDSGSYAKYVMAWTSHTDGTVTGNATTVTPGKLVRIEFAPSTGGTQPTNLYGVSLVIPSGLDLLTSEGVAYGANLSNAAGYARSFDPPVVIDGTATLDLRVSGAGSGKTGTVTIWIER
jgi:hypothetical protein